jgi:hypothetical protein
MGSTTKASFTPFVDPRVYQTSPTDEDEEDEESSAAGKLEGPSVSKTACFPFWFFLIKKFIISSEVKPFNI